MSVGSDGLGPLGAAWVCGRANVSAVAMGREVSRSEKIKIPQ